MTPVSSTYDHSSQKTRDPVRSPLDKLRSGRLVVGWVTTSEYRLLYVFFFFFCSISWWIGQALLCQAKLLLTIHIGPELSERDLVHSICRRAQMVYSDIQMLAMENLRVAILPPCS
jgi:hypothetical protein